jgi:hypothetical protein
MLIAKKLREFEPGTRFIYEGGECIRFAKPDDAVYPPYTAFCVDIWMPVFVPWDAVVVVLPPLGGETPD